MNVLKTLKMSAGAGALMLATAAMAQPAVVRQERVAPGGLYELVFNPADNDLYVAATGRRGASGPVIARIDGRTLAAESTIALGESPLFGLGINSRTQTLYGTATRNNAVTAINLRTGQVAGTITTGQSAHLREVIVDEANNRVYASVFGGGRYGGSNHLWVINGATNTLIRSIPLEVNGLSGIALDARRNRIYGTAMGGNEVVVIDLATDTVAARWPTQSEGPINLAYDAAGNRLFVASQGSGGLTVINTNDGSVIRQVPTGAGALGIAFNPAVNQVYVANRGAGTVTVVDTTNYNVLANLDAGTAPQTIAIDRATNWVYVTNKTRGRRPTPPAAGGAPGGPAAGGPAAGGAPAAAGAPAPHGPPPGATPPAGGPPAGAGGPPPPEDPEGDTVTIIRPR